MVTLEWIRFFIGMAFLIGGLVVFGIELYGVFHYKYVLNRMHAAALGDTLGIALCMLGLIIYNGINFTSIKMVLVVIFLWLASPVASHMVARFEVSTNEMISNECEVEETNKGGV